MTHMSVEKKVMTKKSHKVFGKENCTARENPGYTYGGKYYKSDYFYLLTYILTTYCFDVDFAIVGQCRIDSY